MLNHVFLLIGACFGLLQAATISGVVTDKGAGTGLDSVRVQLRSGTTAVATDTTDAKGAYSFANVDAGRYTIRATKTGYTATSVADTVKAGETDSKVNIALTAIVTATVAGTVKDSAAGTALTGAVVELRSGTTVVAADTSDAAGKYSFEKVAVDSYTVRTTLTGYINKSLKVKVTNSATVTVDIPLVVPVMTTVAGTVKDSAAGTALAGALVQLRLGASLFMADTSDAAGSYTFEKVPVDSYTIRTSLAGYTAKSVVVKATGSAAVTIDIPLSAIVTVSVGGTVTDTITGAAIPGAIVQLRSDNRVVATDTSGADGAFLFASVEKGTYAIRVAQGGYKTKSVVAAVPDSTTVTVGVLLARKVYGGIAGNVSADSLSGARLEGVTIVLNGEDASTDTATTDAQGRYSFDSVEIDFGYAVIGSKTGYTTKSVTLANKKNGVDSVNFFMTSLTTKNIIVSVRKAADSTMIAGAALSLVTTGGGAVIAGVADSTGTAKFGETEAGTYIISVSASGFTVKSGQYAVNAASADTIRIYLAAATGGTKTLTGIITDSTSGNPLGNVGISISIGNGVGAPITLAATTGGNGGYTISGIPTTTSATTLTAKLTGYKTSAKSVALGVVNTADTTLCNLKIISATAVDMDREISLYGHSRPEVAVASNGMISIFNFSGGGIVRLFGLDGKLLHQYPFMGVGHSVVIVQPGILLAHTAMIVRVSAADGTVITGKRTALARF